MIGGLMIVGMMVGVIDMITLAAGTALWSPDWETHVSRRVVSAADRDNLCFPCAQLANLCLSTLSCAHKALSCSPCNLCSCLPCTRCLSLPYSHCLYPLCSPPCSHCPCSHWLCPVSTSRSGQWGTYHPCSTSLPWDDQRPWGLCSPCACPCRSPSCHWICPFYSSCTCPRPCSGGHTSPGKSSCICHRPCSGRPCSPCVHSDWSSRSCESGPCGLCTSRGRACRACT